MKNQKILATFFLVLVLAISAFMTNLPLASAAEVQPQAFLSVNPNPVGINQQVDVTIMLQPIPPTPRDVFHGMTVRITAPDGNVETRGPLTSSPIGSQYFAYTPTMLGTYRFQFSYAGETFAFGEGITYRPAESQVTELVVQQDPIQPYPAAPIPTDYWTRPINAQHRNWYSIAGDWLMRSYSSQYGTFGEVVGYNPYSQAARAPHVMWTKELTSGGLIGGNYSSYSYYGGQAYETKLAPPIIMNGRLYYKTYHSGFSGSPGSIGTGFICVDLRTGEELYKNTQGIISHGQIFNFISANQMGGIAYLWDIFPLVISGAVPTVIAGQYKVYDAFTGDLLMTFANALGGDVVYDDDGTILVYTLNAAQGWFSMWNSTKAFEANGFMQGQASGLIQYRPRSGTYNWSSGVQWNMTVPQRSVTTPGYGLNYAAQGRRMAEDVMIAFGGGVTESRLHVAYSLTTGEELWVFDREGPYPQFHAMGEGIYAQFDPVNMTYIAYRISTGEKLWVSDPLDYPWGQYPANSIGGVIAQGKMFVTDMGGNIYAYDINNGGLLWKFNSGNSGLETPYSSWPMGSGPIIAGGVVYCGIGEHSPTNPLYRGGKLFALDIDTGQELWNMNGWISVQAIADGYLVGYNLYDNRIYCIGKGPSATEVSVSQNPVAQGLATVIQGKVTDQSTGQADTPAIADADMGEWMAYKHQQQPAPTNLRGVPVKLQAISPNGATTDIATVTSNGYGIFAYEWTPTSTGMYTIIATFEGSNSYGSSQAATYLSIGSAQATSPTTSPANAPQPGTGISTETLLIIGAAVIIIAVVAAAAVLLRKRA